MVISVLLQLLLATVHVRSLVGKASTLNSLLFLLVLHGVQAHFQFLLLVNHETISLPNLVENVKLRPQRTQASSDEKACNALKKASTRGFGSSRRRSRSRRSVCRQSATPRTTERCRCCLCCHSRWTPLLCKVVQASTYHRANKHSGINQINQ